MKMTGSRRFDSISVRRGKGPPAAAMLRYQIVKGVNLGVELCEVEPTTGSAAFAGRGGLAHCHRFVESDGVVVTDLLRVGSVDVTLSGCRPTNASGSEIGGASAFRRSGSRDCRQVDREQNRKQEHAYHEHDSVTSAGYRVGLTASRRRTFTGDSSCCPPGGTASESNLNQC